MSKEFEKFSEEFERCRSLINFNEANTLTSLKKGRLLVDRIKKYCTRHLGNLYKELTEKEEIALFIEGLNIIFDFKFSHAFKKKIEEAVYINEENKIIFYVMVYFDFYSRDTSNKWFVNLLSNKKVSLDLFRYTLLKYLKSDFFENCVIHEITHKLQFDNFGNNIYSFSNKRNCEYEKDMFEFYAVKADLFNRCCREFEKEGLTNFSFDQLKNKMSKQGNGTYYKMLINFKGMDFFNRQLMKDYESYMRFGTLLESNVFSEEFFNSLKQRCSTEEERKRVDDPEWRKWFIEYETKGDSVC